MSGRSGYRKTSRRQSPPRPLIERLHDLNKKYDAYHAPNGKGQAAFRAPDYIERRIHLGEHLQLGYDVEVRTDVILARAEPEELLESAARFLDVFTLGFREPDGRGKANFNIPVSLLVNGELSAGALNVIDGRAYPG